MANAVSPPVQRLFDELLTKIFRLGNDLNQSRDSEERYMSPAWRYSAVCPRWRRVAVEDPLLWTEIDIDVSKYAKPALHLQNYVDTLIQRSKSQPLHIRIGTSAYYLSYTTVSTLLSVKHRWASLRITTHVITLLTRMLCVSYTPSSLSLVSLELDLRLHAHECTHLDLRGLHRLENFCEWTSVTVCHILLPWKTLKSFRLYIRQPRHTVASDIQHSSTLQVCCIQLINTFDRLPPGLALPEPKCLFPNVKHLTLISCTPMLPYFQGAQVERLEIHIDLRLSQHFVPALGQLLTCSRFSLKQLDLKWRSMHRADWDIECIVIDWVATLEALQTFVLETHNGPLIPRDERRQLNLSDSMCHAVGRWVSPFAMTKNENPCPLLRHWQSDVIIHSIIADVPDWDIIDQLWMHTWNSRAPLHHCSMSMNVGGLAHQLIMDSEP